MINVAKLRIFSGISVTIWLQKNDVAVHHEYTAIANLAAFAGGKQLDVAPASVKIVSQRYTITEFEVRTVGFPYGNIDRVAAVKHCASGRYVYRASHQVNTGLNLLLNMPGEYGGLTLGPLSVKRHVNLTELSFSSLSYISEV